MYNTAVQVVSFPLKEGSFQVQMEQIPVIRGGMLRSNSKAIPGSSGTIRLQIILLRVLKVSTNPSCLELLKVSVLINLDGQNPSSSNVVINLMPSLVTKGQSSKVKSRKLRNSWSLACLISLAYLRNTSCVMTDSALGCFFPFFARYCSNC